jgi:hypothetical protein
MVPKSERYAAAAQASLACEGMRLTAEEEALFSWSKEFMGDVRFRQFAKCMIQGGF